MLGKLLPGALLACLPALPADTLVPTTPRGVTGHGVTESAIELTWWPSQDNQGIDRYLVRRNGVVVGGARTNYFLDTGLAPNTSYNYTVSAVDPSGNESPRSITRGGYSSAVFTNFTGGNVSIRVAASPLAVRPGERFRASWEVTLNPSGTLGHNDLHLNISLDNFGCNPPECDYLLVTARNGNVYSSDVTAPARTGDIYWIPDPHAATPAAFYNNQHQHYPLTRVVVTEGNPLAITTTSIPMAQPGAPYSHTVTHNSSSEAAGPFAIGVSEGRLPNGLLLDSSTGVISGVPTESGAFPFTVRVKVASENYASRALFLTAGPPAFSAASVANSASFQSGIAPGAIATIFGASLTNTGGVVRGSGSPLPTELDGVSVIINGMAVPLYALANVDGREQINLQVPYEVVASSMARVVVRNNGVSSAAVDVPVLTAHPGLYTFDGVHAAAQHASFALISSDNPASPNESILVYATGLGAVTPAVATGAPPPGNPPARTMADPVVTIAGIPAEVAFSGLAPGFAGLNQLNVRVPAAVPAGEADLIVRVGAQPSNTVRLPIR